MIDLTIKTLDSQNRSFSVPDDYTVRQLKEHIAFSVNIDANVQRLIHCGRVLVDEKKLTEYNVHGKVIHLVERAPLASTRGNPDGSTPNTTNARSDTSTPIGLSNPQPRLVQSRLVVSRNMLQSCSRLLDSLENPTNAATSTSTNSGEGTTTAGTATNEPGEGSFSASQAQNPELVLDVFLNDIAESTSPAPETQDTNDEPNFELATQAATAAALVSAVSAVIDGTSDTDENIGAIDITIEEVDDSRSNLAEDSDTSMEEVEETTSNQVPIVRSPSPSTQSSQTTNVAASPVVMETDSVPIVEVIEEVTIESNATVETPSSGESTEQTNAQQESTTEGSSRTAPTNSRGTGGIYASTNSMANVVAQLIDVNTRLTPFMQQYLNLLRNDPSFSNTSATGEGSSQSTDNMPRTAEEADALFSQISEIMHLSSHALHALSDITCSFRRQEPPRVLRCRPVLIQHSAVLHAGIPVMVPRPMVARRPPPPTVPTSQPNAPSSHTFRSYTIVPTPTNNAATSTQQPPSQGTTPVADTNNENNVADTGPTPPASSTPSTDNPGRVRINRGGVELVMELGPSAVFIEPVGSLQTGENRNSTNSSSVPASGGPFPWGAPPTGFIQNFIRAVSEDFRNNGTFEIPIGLHGRPQALIQPILRENNARNTGTSTTTPASTQAAAGARPTVDATQNSQARGNTQTHPTTATQTRSTSRPQIHLARTIQNHLRTFDPFLPCNSHHIRNRRSGNTSTSTTASSGTTTNSSQNNPTGGWQGWGSQNNNNNASTENANGGANIPVLSMSQNIPGLSVEAAQNLIHSIVDSLSDSMGNIPSSISLEVGAFSRPIRVPANILSNIPSMNVAAGGNSASTGTNNATPDNTQSTNNRTNSTQNDSPQSPPESERGAAQNVEDFRSNLISYVMGLTQNITDVTNGTVEQVVGSNLSDLTGGIELPNIPAFILPRIFTNRTDDSSQSNTVNVNVREPSERVRQFISHHSQTLGALMPMTVAEYFGVETDRRPNDVVEDFCLLISRILHLGNVLLETPTIDSTRDELISSFFSRNLDNLFTSQDNMAWLHDQVQTYCRRLPSGGQEDVDIGATLRELHNSRLITMVLLPLCSRQMRQPSTDADTRTFLSELRTYTRLLVAILLRYYNGDVSIVRNIIHKCILHFASPSVLHTTRIQNVLDLLVPSFLQDIRSSNIDITPYIRFRTTDQQQQQQSTSVSTQEPGSNPVNGEPMDVEVESEHVASAPPTLTLPSDAPLAENVIIGSEPWHNAIPSEWVPIITRDTQRQRREGPQPPFSDAYLSNVPPKRRKIVTSNKPSTHLSTAISDSMTTALRSAGVSTSAETIALNAASDPQLRQAYREQLRAQVRDRIQSSPDFTTERFPNAKKFFDKKKKQ